jgi:hypothetical protein
MRDGLGLASPVRQISTAMPINLDAAGIGAGEFQWGVLLVEIEPYKRIKLTSEIRAFRLEGTGGGGSEPNITRPDQ